MISIVIPTYEQRGHGPSMLAKLFETIKQQVIEEPFEVVVSDNSMNNKIEQVCLHFRAEGLPISYYLNREFIGHCENFNYALDLAKGDLIKLMCMDDVFMHKWSLQQFVLALKKHSWVVSNSVHIDEFGRTKYRKQVQYDPNEFDKNITGMPSVIGYKANELRFDVRFRTYCDLWFYRQLYDKYGMPGFIREFTIGQRFWRNSASRTLPASHEKDRELIKSILNDKRVNKMPGVQVDRIKRIS